ncbi:hypothetical protein E8E13_010532 [Curvularia kusanoi]|uniref:Uncharacterized protein n=1 Tax=Curvularia kusanoi TaxID=90978 RepID=A0A9P4WCQ9_CURKU|nr:hypothetical protein E8E13_010532 [Curvularia kusanoi]
MIWQSRNTLGAPQVCISSFSTEGKRKAGSTAKKQDGAIRSSDQGRNPDLPTEDGQSFTPHRSSSSPGTSGLFKAQRSLTSRKAHRPSKPAVILDAIPSTVQSIYSGTPSARGGQSDANLRRIIPSQSRLSSQEDVPIPNTLVEAAVPTSLYTLLSRYIRHLGDVTLKDEPFICTKQEHELLQREGLAQDDVQIWALSLLKENSNAASRMFQRGIKNPPFVLVLMFLRRKTLRAYSLGVVLNYIAARLEQEVITWQTFNTLAIRLLRHARRVWPESISWISTLFLDKAAKIYENEGDTSAASPRTHSEMTQFCNRLLSLLALPASLRPMIASHHQENAQFRVLQFMAGYNPSVIVTRTGFRAIARVQLTHRKTEQEKDWAELKGPTWPPWKESRTAMDEEKSYEYGASRASKILHRMFEAGYPARSWEEVAEVYAGWDTDLSPTIQTRTLLPYGFRGSHHQRLWAARIRTTRTRREAWACFLACEASGTPAHEQMYLAMFEKLYYMEVRRQTGGSIHQETDTDETAHPPTSTLLPGDMKEVSEEPSSPLHNVYLSEAVPTYEQLFRRMTSRNVRPTTRLLAFLLETYPDFATTLKLVEKAKDDFDGGVGCLLMGDHGESSTVHKIPDYFLAAFVRFLCRFGHSTKGLSITASTDFPAPDQHLRQLMFNGEYLLQYAYALLLHYRPRYQPTWAAFMERVVFSRFGGRSLYDEKDSAMGITDRQYNIVVKLLDTLASVDIDAEGDLFVLACTATRYAAQAVHRGNYTVEQGRNFLSKRSYRLRSLFHHLVGAHADSQASGSASGIPPHIPGPAELHAYVRALGVLRDYEGLYSFSTWLTKHHREVIARAHAQHGGNDMLFRTLVALRAATGGWLEEGLDSRPAAPAEIKQLIKTQIDSVEQWGGWPSKKYVTMYIEGHVRSATPVVGGR